jgi:UDP-N-acetylmuramate--alanine ligase
VIHRSELLARFVAEKRTLAVAGTSGKSSVVAMIFEVLRAAGRDPSVLTGGEILSLRTRGGLGNAWAGGGDLLVVEADESDGSLVRYEPAVALVTNVSRDHQAIDETRSLFERFCARAREATVVGEDPSLAALAEGATVFGLGETASLRAQDVEIDPSGGAFTVEGVRFRTSAPGRHSVLNALAAIAVCRTVGVALDEMVAPLASFSGVARRFETVGTARGVTVIDDYAHNPSKIAAAIAAAKLRGPVVAIWQPHGFGPMRTLLEDLARAFATSLGPGDRLHLLDIYFAGGTAKRDVSSEDLAARVRDLGVAAKVTAKGALPSAVAGEVRSGDVVLVMGARDPTLTALARRVLAEIGR